MTESVTPHVAHHLILAAVYDDEASAQHAVDLLSKKDVSMDALSILGKVHASGDDVLGIYYSSMGERVGAWAKQGALWGALWGLLTGAAAMFIMPGVGAVFAAGPVVDAIIATLGAGLTMSAFGGTVAGATMAGAAALTHLSAVMHRMGVPHEHLEHLHQAIMDGHFVLLLQESPDQAQPWLDILQHSGAKEIVALPYE